MNGKQAFASMAGALAGALAIGMPAHGADVSARAPNAASAAPLPVYNWTGLYIGANIGGALNTENASTPLGTFATDPSGVLGGVQIGYNYEFSSNWLIGVEAEFDWTAAQGVANYNNSVDTATLTSNHNFYDTVDGRLGYVMGPLALFAKGGAAWMNATYQLAGTGAGLGVNATSSVNTSRPGWTIGGGLEYMLSPAWSAKLEYDFLDFGNNTLNFGIPIVGSSLTIGTRVNEIKFGVNYHWPAAMALNGY